MTASQNHQNQLIPALLELCRCYPEMRVGQLLVMATGFAGDDEPGRMEEVSDVATAQAALTHLARRKSTSDGTWPAKDATISALRATIIQELESLQQRLPAWTIGQLVMNLAAGVHQNEYDIEDEDLLTAARSFNATRESTYAYHQ